MSRISPSLTIGVVLATAFCLGTLTAAQPSDLDATRPLNPPSRFGLNAVGYFHRPKETADLDKRWALLKELGVHWDRSDFWWGDIETEPGKWDYAKADAASRLYRSNGVQMFPILCYGAKWRRSEGPSGPAQLAEWGGYIDNVVKRYKGYCQYWEVWNEPNILPFWAPQPNARDYAELLKFTATRARAANPEVRLVAFTAAGLSLPFIERVLDVAGTDCFDVASYHYYRTDRPEERMPDEMNEFRLVLEHYGKECPIWVTEEGVTSNYREGVSEELQAIRWSREILLMIGAGVGRMFPFTLIDNTNDPGGDWGCQLGMVTLGPEYRRKPAFFAYKTIISELDDWDFEGAVWLGEGAKGLLFKPRVEKAGQPRRKLVAWATGDAVDARFGVDGITTVALTPASPGASGKTADSRYTHYTTLAGDKKPVEFGGSTARVALTPSPIFVPVSSTDLERNMATRWTRNAVMCSPGREVSLNLALPPTPADAPAPGVALDGPAGWRITQGDKRAGNQVTIAVPADAPTGWHSVRARVSADGKTLTKELRVWVRPEVEGQFRPSFTPRGKEVSTSFTVQNLNLHGVCDWRVVAKPPVAGLKLPHGRFGQSGMAAKSHISDSFFDETTGSLPATVFKNLGETTVLWFDTRDERGRPGPPKRAFSIAVTPLAATAPTVDGDLREYRSVPKMRIGERDQLTRGDFTGPSDSSAEIAAVWTGEGLFVGADVTDDHPMMNKFGSGGDVYKGDGIELYVGPGGYTGNVYLAKEKGDIHFALSPGIGGSGAVVSDFVGQVSGSRIAVRPRRGGYTLEAFIPKAAMAGYTPQRGDLIAWDAQLNDVDDLSDTAQSRAFMWNGDGMNWLLSAKWGMAVVR